MFRKFAKIFDFRNTVFSKDGKNFYQLELFIQSLVKGRISTIILTLTRPIGLAPPAPVAQRIAEQCTLIASLVKRLFVRVDWTERLRDDSSTTD